MKNKKILKAILNELQTLNFRLRDPEVRVAFKQRSAIVEEFAKSEYPNINRMLAALSEKQIENEKAADNIN